MVSRRTGGDLRSQGSFLAVGLFDPESPIRVRVLHAASRWRSIAPVGRAAGAGRRTADRIFDEQTNGYRIINGESDGWPGLVLDRYAAMLVVKLYTAAWLPRLEEIAGLIRARLAPARIVLRLSRNIRPRVSRLVQ